MIVYSGHTDGVSDSLITGDEYSWRESISIQSGVQIQKCLPVNNSYSLSAISDNYPPDVTRTFTSTGLTRAQVDAIIAGATVKNACFTLTTNTGFTYTGRFRSFSAQSNSNDTETSAFFTASLVLSDLTQEMANTARSITVLG